MKKVVGAIAVLVVVYSCNNKPAQQTYFTDSFSYCKTEKELNEVVKAVGFAPIVASRNYTYANIVAYECIAAGYPKGYYSLAGQINGLKAMPKPITGKSIDFEFAALLAFCKVSEAVPFPDQSMKDYVDSMKAFAKNQEMPFDMFDNSVVFADTIAKTIMARSKRDNCAKKCMATSYINIKNNCLNLN